MCVCKLLLRASAGSSAQWASLLIPWNLMLCYCGMKIYAIWRAFWNIKLDNIKLCFFIFIPLYCSFGPLCSSAACSCSGRHVKLVSSCKAWAPFSLLLSPISACTHTHTHIVALFAFAVPSCVSFTRINNWNEFVSCRCSDSQHTQTHTHTPTDRHTPNAIQIQKNFADKLWLWLFLQFNFVVAPCAVCLSRTLPLSLPPLKHTHTMRQTTT